MNPQQGQPVSPAGAVSLDFSTAQQLPPESQAQQSAQLPQPVTLDFSTAQPISPSTSQAPVSKPAAPAPPAYSWSATPEATGVAEKLERWAGNVENDLLHGTNLTGVGSVLKKMGAHGFEYGNSKGVADFMGSLPLGLAQATQGAAQLPQQGKRWAGTKNIIGGLLDASSIPSAFIAPDVAELAGAGLDAAGTGIGKAATAVSDTASAAAKAAKDAVSTASIQPELKRSLRQALNTVANDIGVQPSNAASIRDVASEIGNAARSKAQVAYQTLDRITQGRFQRFDDALDSLHQQLREVIDQPDLEGALIERLNTVQDAKDAAIEAVKAAGYDPQLIDYANALYKKGSAIMDMAGHIRHSTSGMRPELTQAGIDSTPEVLSTGKLFPRLNSMYDRGRLQMALGEQKAKDVLQAVDTAFLQAQKVQNRQELLKTVAKIGSGALGGYGAYSLVNKVLGN